MAIRPITLAFIKSRCRVDSRTECWMWANYVSKSGYGRINVNSIAKWVHRVTWELVNGPIKPGKRIYSDCESTGCCNPAHLLCGTQLNVVRLAKARGRTSSGLRHTIAITPTRRTRSKLSLEKARQIRSACATGTSQRAAAKVFGVSRFTIQSVLARKTWREPANIFGL